MRRTIRQELYKLLEYKEAKINLGVNLIISYEMMKKVDTKIKTDIFHYNSKFQNRIQSKNQIKEYVKYEINSLVNTIENGATKGSGWIFVKINILKIQIAKSKQTRAGSYIKTPVVLALKHAIVNIKNDDNECIKWCIAAHRNYENIKNKDKNATYNYKKYLDDIIVPDGMTYPIDIDTDVKRFEKSNNIKINVLAYDIEDKNFVNRPNIIYNNIERNGDAINLLLLTEEDKQL